MKFKKVSTIALILGLMAFLVNGDNYAASPLLINISNDFNITIDTAAFSVTSYMLMFGLLTIFIGALGDRLGKMKIILFSAFGTSVFSIICAFSNSITSLIILRAVNGAFASGILPVSIAYVGELAPNDQKQNMIGKVMGLMFFGGTVATSIGGGLAYFGSWKLVYVVYGISELILTVVIYFSLAEQKISESKKGFIKLYKEALSNKQFQKILPLLVFMGYSVLGSFVYVGKLIENKTGYNVLTIGLILGLFGIGTLMAGRKSGTVRSKTGRVFFLIIGIIGFVSMLILSFFDSVILIGLSLLLFGVVFIAFQSSFISISQSELPHIRGTVMSLASFCVVIGGSIGTFLNGVIINSISIKPVFQITAVLLLVISILAFIFIRRIE